MEHGFVVIGYKTFAGRRDRLKGPRDGDAGMSRYGSSSSRKTHDRPIRRLLPCPFFAEEELVVAGERRD